MEQLKQRIDTILTLAVTEYTFSYLNPSLLAAAAIHLVLSNVFSGPNRSAEGSDEGSFVHYSGHCKIDDDVYLERMHKSISAIPVSKKIKTVKISCLFTFF